jgi:hypothetical protein
LYARFGANAAAGGPKPSGSPGSALLGLCLKSEETRFREQEIGALYDSAAYPRKRGRLTASCEITRERRFDWKQG